MVPDFSTKGNSCHDCEYISCAAAVLSFKELEQVRTNSRETLLKKGEVILHEGSLTSHIIYLKSGLVKEYIKHPDNSEQILQIIKEHTYLGLSSLFGDRINHFSYSALQDITVCYIDINIFNKLIKDNGGFAYEILVSVSRDSLNNFHRFVNQSQKRIYGRVADAILYFSNVIFATDEFTLPFTRKEFADLIGVSRESGTRTLIKFKEEGIIDMNGRFLKIMKKDLLEQISKKG